MHFLKRPLAAGAALLLLSGCATPTSPAAQTASTRRQYEEPSTGSLFGGQDTGAGAMNRDDTSIGQRVGAGGGGH